MRPFLLLLVAIASVAAHAAAAPAASTAAAPPTVQQQFDNASEAMAEGRCAEALQTFEALAARPDVARNAKVMATIRARRATCMASVGRFDDAASDAAGALSVLNADDTGDRVEISRAHVALGQVAYFAFDYDNATREFETAQSMATGDNRYEPLLWLARSTMFDVDARSIDFAAAALKLAEALPDVKKSNLATLHTLHARALLNHGQIAPAYEELKLALKAQGGLTERVTMDDVITRSDLALAALLNNDEDSARKYLAYTGAGRFTKGGFAAAVAMVPPPCGGASGLTPDDLVIVQFGVRDDGTVSYASPIYSSRNGPAAAEFARAVAGWSWSPQAAKGIPAFFRLVTRLELHCSMASSHPDVLDILRGDLSGWLSEHHVEPYLSVIDNAASVALAKAELDKLQSGVDPLARVPVLLTLGRNRFIPPAERQQWNQQARAILSTAGAPLGALTYLDIRLSDPLAREYIDYGKHRTYLRTLLASAAVASDPHVSSVLRLLIAEPHYGLQASPDAADLLTTVSTDPGLAAQDPLRVGALVRLATLQAASGNIVAARASYERSGLSAQQCSLVDAMPLMRRSGAESVDFPAEAMRWGFEGWVFTEFDIQADGKTANQRAVIAYPPLVFRDTAIEAMKHARYTQTYRPDGGLGCGGKRVKVSFDLGRY